MSPFKKLLFFAFALSSCQQALAQSNLNKRDRSESRTFYISFGTNVSFFSKSDIRLTSAANPSFDFTLLNVKGKDDKGLRFNAGAPQYSYQLGYYNKRRNFGIEFNFDHIKYYIKQNQPVHIKGTINGHRYNIDTLITPDFIRLEHSDGGNYAILKGVKKKRLAQDSKDRERLSLLIKAGIGPVIPKTNSTIMHKHRDDRYKVSGFVIALEGGLQYTFCRLLFAELNVKGVYADYRRFLIADGTGSQQWFGLHPALLLGLKLSR